MHWILRDFVKERSYARHRVVSDHRVTLDPLGTRIMFGFQFISITFPAETQRYIWRAISVDLIVAYIPCWVLANFNIIRRFVIIICLIGHKRRLTITYASYMLGSLGSSEQTNYPISSSLFPNLQTGIKSDSFAYIIENHTFSLVLLGLEDELPSD